MRLFIAIDCKEQKDYFKTLQNSINNDLSVNKLANDFHITLKFLGKVPESKLDEITDKLKQIKWKSFKFNINKIGFFPKPDYIRVVWVGIEPEQQAIELHKQVDKALSDYKKDFDFVPHITLARVKKILDRDKFFNEISNINYEKRKAIEVKTFKLMSSTLTQEGPIYKTIEEFKCSQE